MNVLTDSLHDGRVVLHRGDCLDVLAGMAEGSAAHVITDPPYERHVHEKRGSRPGLRNDGNADLPEIDFTSIEPIRAEAARQMVRVSAGWLLVFCTPEGVAPWRDAIEAAGGRYKRACVWVKTDAAPQFNGQGPAMGAECFVAAWCGPGHSRWNAGGKRGVWTGPCNPADRHGGHPTEKPLWLMQALVEDFTGADDLVVDPFAGSGTTALACLRAGRRFAGCEIAPRYQAMFADRLARAFDGPATNRAAAARWKRDAVLADAPLFEMERG